MSASVRACALSDLDPNGGLLRFDTDGRSIAIVRLGDKVYALGDRCSHADVSLSEGEVDTDECALECPKHGSLFSLETGEPLSLPALKPVPTYDATVVGDDVMVVVS
jgi:3-phenylpropionate/trans-cinnamate dioxygenase ferredoxin subunit